MVANTFILGKGVDGRHLLLSSTLRTYLLFFKCPKQELVSNAFPKEVSIRYHSLARFSKTLPSNVQNTPVQPDLNCGGGSSTGLNDLKKSFVFRPLKPRNAPQPQVQEAYTDGFAYNSPQCLDALISLRYGLDDSQRSSLVGPSFATFKAEHSATVSPASVVEKLDIER